MGWKHATVCNAAGEFSGRAPFPVEESEVCASLSFAGGVDDGSCRFTYKITIMMDTITTTILECFSEP
ncbi:unnamed protein product, partial [Musa hybrid cultivar]